MRHRPGLLLLMVWLLPALLLPTATSASAQYYPPVYFPPFPYPYPHGGPHDPPPDPSEFPVEFGGYLMLGGAIEETPPPHSGTVIASAGMYAQWNRYGLCQGVDLRIQGNQSQLHGYLVGPRVAYQPRGKMRPIRLYAEGLFGKNEVSYSPGGSDLSPIAPTERVGVTRSIVLGLDLHTGSVFGWRVIEFSKGDFTGLSGSHPQTIMTGIVLHFP